MTTTNKNNRITIMFTLLVLSLILAITPLLSFTNLKPLNAISMASEPVSVVNGDFNASTTTALQSTPSGWTRQETNLGKSGIINVKESNFSTRASTYALTSTQNPGKPYTTSVAVIDDYVLMINAKSSNTTNESNYQGYKSTAVTLNSYSFYKISFWVKTETNAIASMYLELDGEVISDFERTQVADWTEYRFYVATGIESKSATISFWLGTKTTPSYNAVFFDHVTMFNISENYYEDDFLSKKQVHNFVDLRDYIASPITNSDFETGTRTGWTFINYPPLGSNANVVGVNTASAMTSFGIPYVGSDFSANNNFALALYTDAGKSVGFGYESTSFTVMPYETYKITISAKVANLTGNAYIMLVENDDVLDFYGDKANEGFYTPTSGIITVNSNSDNAMTNGYNRFSFLVRGHELYQTSFKLQLWMGGTEEVASGAVIFDTITFERISLKYFNNNSLANSTKVEATTASTDTTITNGAFNFVSTEIEELTYPLTPADWTNLTDDKLKTEYGILNTYTNFYEANKASFGNIVNPGNPEGVSLGIANDVNNILMLWNKQNTYQSVTSTTFSVPADSYYNLSFDYRTIEQQVDFDLLNVYILDSDNNILFADENIYSKNWTNYSLLIKTNSTAVSLKLQISLGRENHPVMAYAYIDNVKLFASTTVTADNYDDYVQNNKALDFQVGNFNLISSSKTHDMFTPYRYTQTLEAGTQTTTGNPIAHGGIIDGNDNVFGITNSPNSTNALNYIPAVRVFGKATYTLVSKDQVTLSASNYYKISIDVYTVFSGDTAQNGVADEDKKKFGAIFALTGLDSDFVEIKTDGNWVTYTLYVKPSDDNSASLRIGIMNESDNITGFAFFDNYKFEIVSDVDYERAQTLAEHNNTILAVGTLEQEETPPATDEEDPNDASIWYVMSSLILAAALLLAVISYYMKKIKIKKWERKKQSEYDRDKTLHRDVIRLEAENLRNVKLSEIKDKKETIQQEINRIEEVHKTKLKGQRRGGRKEISKQEEKEFKAYASKHTKLEEQIEKLDIEIERLNSAEYLLSLQRKISLEKIKKEKQLKLEDYNKQKNAKALEKKEKTKDNSSK